MEPVEASMEAEEEDAEAEEEADAGEEQTPQVEEVQNIEEVAAAVQVCLKGATRENIEIPISGQGV